MLRIDILTLFPSMFDGFLSESIIKRAIQSEKVKITVYNLRDWTKDKHRKVDDKPYGGGPGMVLMCQPIFDAVEDLQGRYRDAVKDDREAVIYLTPQGERFNQRLAREFSSYNYLILLCGHYEGVDERVRVALITHEISIGDYVLTCGELPAMVFIDAVVRLLPGVLGCKDSLRSESFEENLLDYPQYTRPRNFRGMKVPEILLSGRHSQIAKWRRHQSLNRTLRRRRDLLDTV